MIRRICIICDGYPSQYRAENTFVDQLVCQFADMGIDCTVISPQSLTNVFKEKHKLLPKYREKTTLGGNKIKIYVPKYLSASDIRIGAISTINIQLRNFMRHTKDVFKELQNQIQFDAIYGHFIFPAGIVANYLGDKYNIPSFFAYGENTTYTIDYLGKEKTRELLSSICGVISVSSQNKLILKENSIVNNDIVEVFPNSIDYRQFYKRNKYEMRKKYNFPQDAFIIAFVGRFVEIKGADRLSKAIDMLGEDKIKSIFIGSGDIKPSCKGILFQGIVQHDIIPELLSTANIFVLPTQAEGCCNAIIEAMACGLPIVSSNRPFNDDILDDKCSIRIDQDNVAEIAFAIKTIYNDEKLCSELENGALKKAESLNIKERARSIVNFMDERISSIKDDTKQK
jgi:teichuronic acid biosynthesis glycosyltransferase TuaC